MTTKQRILDAALTVFGRYGFRQTSMELVAEETGLSRQALYRHFPTKEALFAAVSEDLHDKSQGAVDAASETARASGQNAQGILLAQLSAKHEGMMSLLVSSPHAEELLAENSRLCGALAAKSAQIFKAQLVATIARERKAGRLSLVAGITNEELAEHLQTAARGLKAAVPPPTIAAFNRDLARLVRVIMNGATQSAEEAPRKRAGTRR